jgi:hypothetical protein
MDKSKLSPENAKELEELARLLSRNKRPKSVKKPTRKEARALLGYITNLENARKGAANQAEQPEHNQKDLDIALIKLVGISIGLPYED